MIDLKAIFKEFCEYLNGKINSSKLHILLPKPLQLSLDLALANIINLTKI